MHKRARNHKIKVYCEEADKILGVKSSLWKEWGFNMHTFGSDKNYEPQGKREARKYVKGLLYYKPSNFNELHFSQYSKR